MPFSSVHSSNCFPSSIALKRLREAANSNDLDTGKASVSPTWDLFLEGRYIKGSLGKEEVGADSLWTGCFRCFRSVKCYFKARVRSLSTAGLVIVFTFSLHLVHCVSFPSTWS